MTKKAVISLVNHTKREDFVTARNPEHGTLRWTAHWECILACNHYEYRTLSRMHDPPRYVVCRTCTKRKLTVKELNLRDFKNPLDKRSR